MNPKESPKPLPWLKIILVVLPTGLIVSMVIAAIMFMHKREQSAERSIKYAAGLAREINAVDMDRTEKILSTTKDAAALASFIESTMGPENMGYSVRQILQPDPGGKSAVVGLDVELTGTQRPREIVLVLGSQRTGQSSLLDAARVQGLSAMLAVAHAMTGSPQVRSTRFACVADLNALRLYYEQAIAVNDRINHVILCGAFPEAKDEDISTVLRLQGAAVHRLAMQSEEVETAKALRQEISTLAGRL